MKPESTEDEGDARRLTHLFNEYQLDIQKFARRRVGADASQEIVAETFLVAWRRLHDIPDPALPWLYRVATLEVANFQRRQIRSLEVARRIRESLLREASQEGTAAEGDRDALRIVARAFEALGAADQEILRLATWDELTTTQGAIVLGCSNAAYRVRLHRARTRLAKNSRLLEGGLWRATVPDQPSRENMTATDAQSTLKQEETG